MLLCKKNVFVKVLHLQGDSKKNWQIQVSYNFQIITLNWVRIYRTQEKTGFKKSLSKRSRSTKINTMGLNELNRIITLRIFIWHISGSLIFCISRYKENFPFKLTMSTTIWYIMPLKAEWKHLSIYSSLPDSSRIWELSKYSYFYGNIVIYISLVRICSCNRTQLETLVLLPRFWMECHISRK